MHDPSSAPRPRRRSGILCLFAGATLLALGTWVPLATSASVFFLFVAAYELGLRLSRMWDPDQAGPPQLLLGLASILMGAWQAYRGFSPEGELAFADLGRIAPTLFVSMTTIYVVNGALLASLGLAVAKKYRNADRERDAQPDSESAGPWRSVPLGTVSWVFGDALTALSIIGFVAGPSGVAALLWAIPLCTGRALSSIGRRLRSPKPSSVLDSAKGYTLYLRSFDDDEKAHPTGSLSEEEILSDFLAGNAPMLAIGEPRELIPDAGAARLYVPDANWQQRVRELATGARVVFLRIGTSDGVIWESRMLVQAVEPHRLLLYLPDPSGQTYNRFRVATQGVFPRGLPERVGAGMFVSFDSDWTPTIIEPSRGRWLTRKLVKLGWGTPLVDLRATLSPQLSRAGYSFPRLGAHTALRLGCLGANVLAVVFFGAVVALAMWSSV